MQVRILEKHFGGVEFCPEVRVLHLGGQSSACVERLYFELPESWQGKSVTLHIQRQDGTLPTPILLDEESSAAVGKEFTASACGMWMLLALGEDGYRALTRPARYDCYETLNTDGEAEISPTQYEIFVAQVLRYSNDAQTSAREAGNAAERAERYAQEAASASVAAGGAADTAAEARDKAGEQADRAEEAAKRAAAYAPEDGPVTSVNGKGGAVELTADDVGAVDAAGRGYVKAIELQGRTLTLLLGDGSVQTFETKDTTNLEAMTGILSAEHVETDDTLTRDDAPANARAVGDALTGKLGVHDTAENAAAWGGKTLNLTHDTKNTWVPVFADGEVHYVLKSEIASLNGIAESGEGYVRFTNGLQMCWGINKDTVPAGSGMVSGSFLFAPKATTKVTTVTYPAAFSEIPTVTVTLHGYVETNEDYKGLMLQTYQRSGRTAFSYVLINFSSGAMNPNISWFAIGTWK